MRPARTHFVVSAVAFLCAFALTMGSALAAGSLTYSKKQIQESNGGWHLMMTIGYGGKPNTAHVPMRFTFTPTAITERFLDDAHGDKPQTRKIPLVGQSPLNESVDVDFSDPSGKLFDKTRFDFTVTRSHNFVAGDYSVAVHRADGASVGGPQTLVFEGENTVIDSRAISFVGTGPKKKPAADAGAAPSEGEKTASAPAAGAEETAAATPTPAAETPPADDPSTDPTAAAKVPPGSHGCGCRTAPSPGSGSLGLTLGALAMGSLLVWRLRRRRLPV